MNPPDYWTLTNVAYLHWKAVVLLVQKYPDEPLFRVNACRAQADYVMFSAIEQWEINHGKRKV